MLKRNTSDSYPGADFVAADPITAAECCQHQSVASMIAALVALGAPYIMRGGKLFFDQAAMDQVTMCTGPAPDIQGMSATDWEDGMPIQIDVDDRGEPPGEVWVGSNANFGASMTLVEQTVNLWSPGDIQITSVQGGFGTSPPPAFCFVVNNCGRPNLVGFQIAWIEV